MEIGFMLILVVVIKHTSSDKCVKWSEVNTKCELCETGYAGANCTINCKEQPDLQDCCPNCIDPCNQATGEGCMFCKDGYFGPFCTYECSGTCSDKKCSQFKGICLNCNETRWGNFCEHECNCKCNQGCERWKGTCFTETCSISDPSDWSKECTIWMVFSAILLFAVIILVVIVTFICKQRLFARIHRGCLNRDDTSNVEAESRPLNTPIRDENQMESQAGGSSINTEQTVERNEDRSPCLDQKPHCGETHPQEDTQEKNTQNTFNVGHKDQLQNRGDLPEDLLENLTNALQEYDRSGDVKNHLRTFFTHLGFSEENIPTNMNANTYFTMLKDSPNLLGMGTKHALYKVILALRFANMLPLARTLVLQHQDCLPRQFVDECKISERYLPV